MLEDMKFLKANPDAGPGHLRLRDVQTAAKVHANLVQYRLGARRVLDYLGFWFCLLLLEISQQVHDDPGQLQGH